MSRLDNAYLRIHKKKKSVYNLITNIKLMIWKLSTKFRTMVTLIADCLTFNMFKRSSSLQNKNKDLLTCIGAKISRLSGYPSSRNNTTGSAMFLGITVYVTNLVNLSLNSAEHLFNKTVYFQSLICF